MADLCFEDLPSWLDVSRETFADLGIFVKLVRQWTGHINLISPATVPEIWSRHVLDSAQLFDAHPKSGHWVDLGSGGGFPGIVLAILAKHRAPGLRFSLVESDRRKGEFLRKASRELALQVVVCPNRAETLAPCSADVVTARAMAPLNDLLTHVHRHMAETGVAILPKGSRADEEIAAALKIWRFDLSLGASHTDPNAKILRIVNLSHV